MRDGSKSKQNTEGADASAMATLLRSIPPCPRGIKKIVERSEA